MRVILSTIRKTSPYVFAPIKKAGEVAYDIAEKHGQDIFYILQARQNKDTFVSSKLKKSEKQNQQYYL